MPFSRVTTAAINGIDTEEVSVEVHIDMMGFPGFHIVGLASKEVEESKERVRSAIKNSGFTFPNRKITVNLAPADVSKKGSFYDLPIAIGILKAANEIIPDISNYFFIGELSLDGSINSINGSVPLALESKKLNKILVLPAKNKNEILIIKNLKCVGTYNLKELADHINGTKLINTAADKQTIKTNTSLNNFDFRYIKGQKTAKRALEIAAAGGHNISLKGPPGSGKTMLARSLVSIIPPLSDEESLIVTKIYSIAGLLSESNPIVNKRPFRDPHHTITKAGLLGGGSPIMPGDITLSHLGVLFLDEFSEFNKDLIESLRGPLEDNKIRISRIRKSIEFPCNFILVAASNPCLCGYLGSNQKECTCSYNQIKKFNEKISGPILDRIDLHINVDKVEINKLNDTNTEESSSSILQRVKVARQMQNKRYNAENDNVCFTNANLSNELVNKFCKINTESLNFLEKAANALHLSARSYFKILKVSRTIADLDNNESILLDHLKEALQYRNT